MLAGPFKRKNIDISRIEIPFEISDFVIDPDRGVPLEVADKILKYHIQPMLPFRLHTGVMIWPSQSSCYRNKIWEQEQGRAPSQTGKEYYSAHAFEERHYDKKGLGACDWTSLKKKLTLLGEELADELNPYKRVCYYPSQYFFHCDYDYDKSKGLWISRQGSWEKVDKDTLLQAVWRDSHNGA